MRVGLIVPFQWLDIVDVKVEPELSFEAEAGEDRRHEDQILFFGEHGLLVLFLLLSAEALDVVLLGFFLSNNLTVLVLVVWVSDFISLEAFVVLAVSVVVNQDAAGYLSGL